MACLRSKFRHLYLLALFQLVGGPLVLVPMLLMSKAVVRETVQHGVVEGIHLATVSPEWDDARGMIQNGAGAIPESPAKAPGAPEKSGEGKPKLSFIAWTTPALMELESGLAEKPAWEWQPMASHWANAPPSPPPRVA